MTKIILWALAIGIAAAVLVPNLAIRFPEIAGLIGTPAPAGAARTLTPPWPPATSQATTVSGDLFAPNYYVVLDASGSMGNRGCSGEQTKLEVAKAALASFAASLPANANLGLQVFDRRGVNEWLPFGANNREQFAALLGKVSADGGTPLLNAVTQAYARLLAQGRRQLGYGEYHLVIVTDGDADKGQDPTPVVNSLLQESPIVMHTIGFCIDSNHALNQAGRTIYKAADNPQALRQGLSDVLAEAPQFSVTKFK